MFAAGRRKTPMKPAVANDKLIPNTFCTGPIDAILSEDELPDDQIEFIEINARLSEVYENITEAKEPLPDAKKFETVINKRSLIDL